LRSAAIRPSPRIRSLIRLPLENPRGDWHKYFAPACASSPVKPVHSTFVCPIFWQWRTGIGQFAGFLAADGAGKSIFLPGKNFFARRKSLFRLRKGLVASGKTPVAATKGLVGTGKGFIVKRKSLFVEGKGFIAAGNSLFLRQKGLKARRKDLVRVEKGFVAPGADGKISGARMVRTKNGGAGMACCLLMQPSRIRWGLNGGGFKFQELG